MGTEENYLDNLLKAVMEPKPVRTADMVKTDAVKGNKTEDIHENIQESFSVPDLPEVPDQRSGMEPEPGIFSDMIEQESAQETADTGSAGFLEELEAGAAGPVIELPEDVEFPDIPEFDMVLEQEPDITEEPVGLQEPDMDITLDSMDRSETEIIPVPEPETILEDVGTSEIEVVPEPEPASAPEDMDTSEIEVVPEPESDMAVVISDLPEPEPDMAMEIMELPEIMEQPDIPESGMVLEPGFDITEEPVGLQEPDMDITLDSMDRSETEIIPVPEPETMLEDAGTPEIKTKPEPEPISTSEDMDTSEIGIIPEPEPDLPDPDMAMEIMELPEIMEQPDIPELNMVLEPEPDITEEPVVLPDPDMDITLDSMEQPESEPLLEDMDTSEIEIKPEPETMPEGMDTSGIEIKPEPEPDLPLGAETDFDMENLAAAGIEPELEIGDAEVSEMNDRELLGQSELDELLGQSELNIEGLDKAIQSETELEMAGELNIEDLDNITAEFGSMPDIPDMPDISDMPNIPDMRDIPDIPDLQDDLDLIGGGGAKPDAGLHMDDNLDDVLSMLDDDAELAEINDMLKKSDNNEPIQDDMMSLLNQMADDEAASVNAGVKTDEETGSVPLSEDTSLPSDAAGEDSDDGSSKKKARKASKKKKKDAAGETGGGGKEKPGKMGKFFNMLTEDLVPEPTEEELEAEKAARTAKKQEEMTKKEQDKAAKAEAKKAKAEEKEAAKKVKAEAAAKAKKEKQAAKDAKLAAKRAKQAAEPPKKRIPPKKIAVVSFFGASVGAAVIIGTNVLSTQGYLRSARKAYYDQDYMAVYQNTYGMELDDTQSDGLIQARSEVLLKLQCRYDSYLVNLKIGREVEALDALLQGILTYDTVNADAEIYDVLPELDAIMATIYNTLEARYGLDESAARALMSNEDALSYTIALTDIISRK